jgi:PAS domain S-box-containing protein
MTMEAALTASRQSVLQARLTSASAVSGVIVLAAGCAVMVGWLFDVTILTSLHPRLVSMKPNTALCFVLIGISLWLARRNGGRLPDRSQQWIRRIAAGIVCLMGAATLVEYGFGYSLGIDQWLIAEPPGAVATAYAGRMAVNTAINFVLIGMAIILIDLETKGGHRPAQYLALVAGLVTVAAMLGYLHGVQLFYGFSVRFTAMALHTAALFCVACAGVLCARPDAGLMRLMTSDSLGGRFVRRLIPSAALVLLLLEEVRIIGERMRLYDRFASAAVFAVLWLLAFTLLLWVAARWLHRADMERRQAHADAEEREKRWRSLLQATPSVILCLSPEHRITEFNAEAERIYGRKREDVLNKNYLELFLPPEAREAVAANIWKVLAGHPTRGFENEVLTANGGRRVFSWSVERLMDVHGQPSGIIAVGHDVTQRRRAQEAQRRLAAIVQSSDDAIFSQDLNGIVLTWNPSAERMSGYSASEMIGKPVTALLERSRVREATELLERVKAGDHVVHWETKRLTKSGNEIDVAISMSPLRDELGKIAGASVIARDVTQQKRAEEEMRRLSERLLLATRAAGVGIWDYDVVTNRLVWDDQMCRLYGITPQQFNGAYEAWEARVHPDDLSRSREEVQQALRGRRDLDTEFRVVWPDHTVHTLKAFALVQRGADGKALRMLGTNWDITEHKFMDELLQQTLVDLERSNEELGQFAYVASHDLQEPLRKVKSFTELLAEYYRGKMDPKVEKYVAYIVDGAERMQALIANLLLYSRVGREELPFATTDLNDVLGRVLSDLDPSIQEAKAVVSHDTMPTLYVNAQQIGLVFQNLVSNAVKFRGSEPPRIDVRAERQADEWVLSVRDRGIGMDPRDLGRLFQLFQRLHTRASYPGTGIGLAICKKIVASHGGRIWVESEPGKGSCFFFTLPAMRTVNEASDVDRRKESQR